MRSSSGEWSNTAIPRGSVRHVSRPSRDEGLLRTVSSRSSRRSEGLPSSAVLNKGMLIDTGRTNVATIIRFGKGTVGSTELIARIQVTGAAATTRFTTAASKEAFRCDGEMLTARTKDGKGRNMTVDKGLFEERTGIEGLISNDGITSSWNGTGVA